MYHEHRLFRRRHQDQYEGPRAPIRWPSAITIPTRWSWASAWKTICASRCAYWHSFAGRAATRLADRPSSGRGSATRWTCQAQGGCRLRDVLAAQGALFYCFHDFDVRPEGANFAENTQNLEEIVDYLRRKQEQTGVKLLVGHGQPVFQPALHVGGSDQSGSGCLCLAAATVKTCMDATHKLGGENYVLVGRPRRL
jgi:xylose isomerase